MMDDRALRERLAPIQRGLGDRSYDKRKKSALEVEALVRQLQSEGNAELVKSTVTILSLEFTQSPNLNLRKGGLIGLAATAIALMQDTRLYLDLLLPPVLHCFEDPEGRVRYYACESLFNIAKVARGFILPYFNRIFEGLCKLFADTDVDVKNGAQLLDRLIKEIVTESETFDVEAFIPFLKKYMNRTNAYVRQLLVSWITVLDSVPEIDMLDYLPEFLSGLFSMLSDGNREIRQQADQALVGFLRGIKESHLDDFQFAPIVHILVQQCGSKEKFNRLTAITWALEFVGSARQQLVPLYPQLLDAVMRCISDTDKEIRMAAERANQELLELVKQTRDELNYAEFLGKLTLEMISQDTPTRVAALTWVSMLLEKSPSATLRFVDELFPVLCRMLSDVSEQVVLLDLEVMARIALSEQQFLRVLTDVLRLFSSDRRLLERRGNLVVRNLCVHLNADRVYNTMAKVLRDESDLEFAGLMVQALNLILLTAPELAELRATLKASWTPAAVADGTAQQTFRKLFSSWCHDPVSTFSLCLLSQAYELASELVTKFADIDVTLGFLMQLDKLVHLLESPIFIHLRLQLLQPEHAAHAHLLRSLYGLLMLLPQSNAFNTLRNRLTSVSSLHLALAGRGGIVQSADESARPSGREALAELLQLFEQLQRRHTLARQAAIHSREIRSPLGSPVLGDAPSGATVAAASAGTTAAAGAASGAADSSAAAGGSTD